MQREQAPPDPSEHNAAWRLIFPAQGTGQYHLL